MRWWPSIVMVSLFTLGCGGGSSPGGNRDGGRDGQGSLTLPDLPPGCPPKAGNENGIGTPCTKTGSECTGTLQCSCKDWFGYAMPAEMPCFCTGVTFGPACASSCGSNATCCTYDVPVQTTTVTVSACFPSVCAPGNKCPSIQ
jgi:hypothetical protein